MKNDFRKSTRQAVFGTDLYYKIICLCGIQISLGTLFYLATQILGNFQKSRRVREICELQHKAVPIRPLILCHRRCASSSAVPLAHRNPCTCGQWEETEYSNILNSELNFPAPNHKFWRNHGAVGNKQRKACPKRLTEHSMGRLECPLTDLSS